MPQNNQRPSDGVGSTTGTMVAGLKDFNSETWNRLVRLYTPLVYHWCQKLDVRPDDIPDVVQEVFKSVAENIGKFQKDKSQGSFRGWLRVITRRKAIDLYRKKEKEPQGEGGTEAFHKLQEFPSPDVDDEEQEGPKEQSIFYNHALELIREEFKDSTWQAFWGVVVDGRMTKDVAVDLNVSGGSVRVAKCRVLQRLRQVLGEMSD